MKKEELKAIAEKYGMEIIRNPITQEAWKLQLVCENEIKSLTDICNTLDKPPVISTIKYTPFDVTYEIVCPTSWFDLWGWA